MPNFVYKCDVCHRTVEEFRKVDEREEVKWCSSTVTITKDGIVTNNPLCPGSLIFQPMQKTNFTMHHLGD